MTLNIETGVVINTKRYNTEFLMRLLVIYQYIFHLYNFSKKFLIKSNLKLKKFIKNIKFYNKVKKFIKTK